MHLPSEREALVRYLVSAKRSYQRDLQAWRDEASTYNRLYKGMVDEDAYPLPFAVHVPISYSVIETLLPRWMNGALAKNPIVQLTKGDTYTTDGAVWAANRILNDRWLVDPEMWVDLYLAPKESVISGMAAGKVVHTKRKRRILHREPVTVNGITVDRKVVPRTVCVYNRPRYVPRDIFDVIHDVEATKASNLRFVCDSVVKDLDEIEHGEVRYDNLSDLAASHDWDPSAAGSYHFDRLQGGDTNRDHRYQAAGRDPENRRKPRLLDEWTIREWTEDGIEQIRIITIGNEQVLLRDDVINYWPWIFWVNNPMPHEFLGYSELEPIKDLQFAVNDTWNMNQTNSLAAITKHVLVGDDAECDLEQFVLDAFNVIQCGGDINQVRYESWADRNPAGERDLKALMEFTQLASGVQDFTRGATAPRKEYATTVTSLQQAAEARFDAKFKLWGNTALVEIPRAMIECAQEYQDEPDYVPRTGNPNVLDEIDMYKLQGLFTYRVGYSGTALNEMKRAALNDFTPLATALLANDMPVELRLQLLMDVAKTNHGFEEVAQTLEQALARLAPQPGAGEPLPGGAAPVPGGAGPDGSGGLEGLVGLLTGGAPPAAGSTDPLALLESVLNPAGAGAAG